jgi:iron complex transport system substrate-binding protein
VRIGRRSLLMGAAATLAAPHVARAQTIIDSAGRAVPLPAKVERVFPAGPPAAITHYTLQPRTMLGWPRANRAGELVYLDPEIGARPELGRLTGRGNTTNLEVLLQLKPDIILDIGSTARTCAETADRVQSQTGIPYALLDGRFSAIPESYRLHGRLVAETARAEDLARFCDDLMRTCRSRVASVPQEKRPRVYWRQSARDGEGYDATPPPLNSFKLARKREPCQGLNPTRGTPSISAAP